MDIRPMLVSWGAAACTLFLSASVAGQSAFHDLDASLLVLPLGESPALVASADRLYRESQKLVVELEGWQRAGGLQLGKIGATNVSIVKLERMAGRLKSRHEAAGFDYALRGGDLKQRLLRMATEAKKIQGFSNNGAVQQLAALRDSGLPKLPGWRKQVGQGGYEKVSSEVFALLDAMQEHLIWLEGNATSEFVTPFQEIADLVTPQMAAADQRAIETELYQQLQRPPPDGEQLRTQLQAAATEVEQTGAANWQGQILRGPQLVVAAHQAWQRLEVEFQRRRAWLWAQRGESRELTLDLTELEDAERALAEQMPASLSAIVAADARRVPIADAEALYHEYLSSLGPVVALGPKEPLLELFQPPLDKIAAKSPGFNSNLKSYRAFANDLLRWQKRLAAATADGRRSTYPLATAAFNEAARSQLNSPGLLPEKGQGSETAAILGPVPLAVRKLGKALADKPVTILDVVSDGRRGQGRYHERTYASLPLVANASRANLGESLRQMFYLSAEEPPLTLDGAAALAAAEQGIFSQVGGTIENVRVEPLIARFATIKDGDALRFPLTPLAEEPVQLDLRSHLVVQFRLRPTWVQHELLLLDLK